MSFVGKHLISRRFIPLQNSTRCAVRLLHYNQDGAPCIGTQQDVNSPEYQEKYARMKALVDELKGHVSTIVQGGGEKAVNRHTSRGKLMPRERINALLDPQSPFLEFSQLAGKN